MISGFQVQQKSLIASTLETNHAYAVKMSQSTELYLSMTLQSLGNERKACCPLHGPRQCGTVAV